MGFLLSTFLCFVLFSMEFPSFYVYFFESSAGSLEAACTELVALGHHAIIGFGHFEVFCGAVGQMSPGCRIHTLTDFGSPSAPILSVCMGTRIDSGRSFATDPAIGKTDISNEGDKIR
jgi:hypothetical protein